MGVDVAYSISEPWKPQQDHLRNVFDEANQLRQKPLQYYPGQTFAGKTGADSAAESYLQNFATGAASSATGNAIQSLDFGLNAMDLQNNPYVGDYVDAATQPLYDQLTRTALPAIRSGAGLSGQAGSSRQAIAEGLAIGETQRAAGEVSANILNDAYGKGLDTYGKALALTPQTVSAGTLPAELLGAVGSSQRGFEQQIIDDSVQRFNFNQYEPYDRLSMYKNFISGDYGGTTANVMPKKDEPSGLQKALGGLSTGLGTFGALSGAGGALGAMAGPIGIGLGALAAFA